MHYFSLPRLTITIPRLRLLDDTSHNLTSVLDKRGGSPEVGLFLDDRKPVPKLTRDVFGKLFADKGDISRPLFETLLGQGLQLITSIRKNMKNRLLPMIDKLLLRKRAFIETIDDQLKNISQIEHTRHRSVANFMVNLICGLIAYTHQSHKPSLNLGSNQLILLNG